MMTTTFFSHSRSEQFLKQNAMYFNGKDFFSFISTSNFYSGLCHQGAFKLPSGKWLCVVNDEIKKTYAQGQQFCKNNGFDRLFEVSL